MTISPLSCLPSARLRPSGEYARNLRPASAVRTSRTGGSDERFHRDRLAASSPTGEMLSIRRAQMPRQWQIHRSREIVEYSTHSRESRD